MSSNMNESQCPETQAQAPAPQAPQAPAPKPVDPDPAAGHVPSLDIYPVPPSDYDYKDDSELTDEERFRKWCKYASFEEIQMFVKTTKPENFPAHWLSSAPGEEPFFKQAVFESETEHSIRQDCARKCFLKWTKTALAGLRDQKNRDPEEMHEFRVNGNQLLADLEFAQAYLEKFIDNEDDRPTEAESKKLNELMKDPMFKRHVEEMVAFFRGIRPKKLEAICKFEQQFNIVGQDQGISAERWMQTLQVPCINQIPQCPQDLFQAIKYDQLKTVQDIVLSQVEFDFAIEFTACNTKAVTYIDIAAYFGSAQCFKYFFMNGIKLTELTCKCALCGGNFEIVRFVQQQFAKENNISESAVYRNAYSWAILAFYHHEALYDWYINTIMNPNDKFPIRSVIASHNYYIFKRRLATTKGEIFDQIRDIGLTCVTGMIRLYYELLAPWMAVVNKNIPECDSNAVTRMVKKGTIPILLLVMELEGFDPNVPDKNKRTILHYAARSGNVQNLEQLIKMFPKFINARDEHKRIPLFDALYAGNTQCAITLWNHGADINAKDDLQRTTLHAAVVGNCHISVKKYLEKHGVDQDAVDYEGFTYKNISRKYSEIWQFTILV